MRLFVAAVMLIAIHLAGIATAEAAGGNENGGCTTTVQGGSSTTVCNSPGGGSSGGSSGGSGSSPEQPACSYTPVPIEVALGIGPHTPPIPSVGFVYFAHPDGSVGRRFPDGREEKGHRKVCDDGTDVFVWIEVTITVQDVIDDATARAIQHAPLPVLDVSPDPAAGGIVNLGMWLAVDAPVPPPVRVAAGGHWATAELTPLHTTWSMGDGHVVTCEGTGVPLDDPDTAAEGPCGHTYRHPTPDGSPHQLTATLTWSVDFTSSGGSGHAGTIDRAVTAAYDVDEIQSIGTHSGSSG